jgi:hypothetical protein
MSSSTILEDELEEKHLSAPRPDLARTESNLEKAIDAEAHIDILPAAENAPVLVNDGDEPGPPPNGGLRAWLQVVGSFFLFFNCWYECSAISQMNPSDKT